MALSTRYSLRVKRGMESKMHNQQLIDMPLDVLVEIFQFLEPLDLLYLARTTKGFREFLLDRRKCSTLWKSVISNVEGFPPCPDYMSAPAYTHLAFVPVCHGCFCLCETIEWELRMRCCPDCFPKMTICESSISGSKSANLNGFVLPTAVEHLKLCDNSGSVITVSYENIRPSSYFSRLDWKVARSSKRSGNISSEEFLSQLDEHWRSIQKHARLCRHWEHGRLSERAAQLSIVRKQRIEEIKSKLKDMGWSDVVLSASCEYNFMQLPQVRKLEPLTSTEWARLRPQLVSWVRKSREYLVWNDYMKTLTFVSQSIREELRSDFSLKVQPRDIDIAMLPVVHSVFANSVSPNANHDDLKKKLFRVLPPAIKKWSSGAIEELERFAREGLNLPPLSKPSRLPSVIFRCKVCFRRVQRHSRLTFDAALSHDHLYKEMDEDSGESTGDISSPDKFIMVWRTYARNIQVLQVDVSVSQRVENLVRRMGQNPSRVTHRELCHSTVKVVCGLCQPQVATRMNFRQAFDHCLDTHLRNKETEVWTRVSTRE